MTAAFYRAVLSAERPFAHSIPWNNQKIDVHPPLYYYCLVYTAESLFRDWVLWVGLLPNFVCLLGQRCYT